MAGYTKDKWKESFIVKTQKAGITGCTFSALLSAKKGTKPRSLQEAALGELLTVSILFRVGQQKVSRGVVFLHNSVIESLAAKLLQGTTDSSYDKHAPDLTELIEAINRCARRTGFGDIRLAVLTKELGCPVKEIEGAIRELVKVGRAVLGHGDWSLATPVEKESSILFGEERYLTIRLRS
jgi:hypothetical protein